MDGVIFGEISWPNGWLYSFFHDWHEITYVL